MYFCPVKSQIVEENRDLKRFKTNVAEKRIHIKSQGYYIS